MNTRFFSSSDIKKEMEHIERIGALLSERLGCLERIISAIFAQIKTADDKDAAREYFEILDQIQGGLALLVHRDDLGISDRLWRFMQDFDNFEQVITLFGCLPRYSVLGYMKSFNC